jgi:hypothetical protein
MRDEGDEQHCAFRPDDDDDDDSDLSDVSMLLLLDQTAITYSYMLRVSARLLQYSIYSSLRVSRPLLSKILV